MWVANNHWIKRGIRCKTNSTGLKTVCLPCGWIAKVATVRTNTVNLVSIIVVIIARSKVDHSQEPEGQTSAFRVSFIYYVFELTWQSTVLVLSRYSVEMEESRNTSVYILHSSVFFGGLQIAALLLLFLTFLAEHPYIASKDDCEIWLRVFTRLLLLREEWESKWVMPFQIVLAQLFFIFKHFFL